ncbi:hypothetical protein HanRHA438_Chr03g0110111 [Helianthus annuus]|nr:hypothetical protein HanIR_Chr03g0108081 [Helianthus annuus]KAJ0934674.1 hypothetical protein HanRHA438_Chr03g0110111 [Helianthus annuus]
MDISLSLSQKKKKRTNNSNVNGECVFGSHLRYSSHHRRFERDYGDRIGDIEVLNIV